MITNLFGELRLWRHHGALFENVCGDTHSKVEIVVVRFFCRSFLLLLLSRQFIPPAAWIFLSLLSMLMVSIADYIDAIRLLDKWIAEAKGIDDEILRRWKHIFERQIERRNKFIKKERH